MFIAQFKPMQMKEPGAEEKEKEPEQKQEKAPEAARSNSSEEFLATPEAKQFVGTWAGKLKDGKPIFTKRGITELLGALHRNSGMSDKEVMKEAERILMRLSGLDKFSSFLGGMKAKAEGLIKGLKQALGG